MASFLLLGSEDAYEKANEMLTKRFGDPFVVASSCRSKLESWHAIHPNEDPGMRKFADYLVKCEQLIKTNGSLRVLDEDHENRKLASKLPRWASNRWSRAAFNWKEEKGTFPPFSEFVKFVVREADIACDPTLSSPPPSNNNLFEGKRSERRRQFQGGPPRVNTFMTSSAWKIPERKETSDSKKCALCNKARNIDTCYEFMKKPISDRKAFASTKGPYFRCLEYGHLSKDCPKRSTCNVCRKSHPTSLHGDFKRREREQGDVSTVKDPSKPPRIR